MLSVLVPSLGCDRARMASTLAKRRTLIAVVHLDIKNGWKKINE